jgi:voltage-gated potassium channel
MQSKLTAKFVGATDTLKELLMWLAVTLLVSALLFSWLEARSFIDSLWWAITTGMTIGYGDIYPHTNGGRLVASVLVFTNIFVILPMYTARLAAKFIVEADPFTREEQEGIKSALARIEKQTEKKDA